MVNINKALIIPYNKNKEILIQDRSNYKPPPWGFFGGSIESGETALEAVIRETKEELSLDITKTELKYIGEFSDEYKGYLIVRQVYIFMFNQSIKNIKLREGKGLAFKQLAEAKK